MWRNSKATNITRKAKGMGHLKASTGKIGSNHKAMTGSADVNIWKLIQDRICSQFSPPVSQISALMLNLQG